MDKITFDKSCYSSGQTGLWYLGQEGFVIASKGTCLAVDPYLSDYVDRNCCQYVQWRRNYPAPVKPEDLDMLENLAHTITDTALCGLGKSAAQPVMSTLKNFREEYVAQVVDKKCPAHACTSMRSFVIDPELCKGCSKCARGCPVGAIEGQIKNPFKIDQNKCIRCGACINSCRKGAVVVE